MLRTVLFIITIAFSFSVATEAQAEDIHEQVNGYGQVLPCSEYKDELSIPLELSEAAKWGLTPEPNFVLDSPDYYRTQCTGLECCGFRGSLWENVGLADKMKKTLSPYLAYRNVYASLMNGTIHRYNEWQNEQLDAAEFFQCCAEIDSSKSPACLKNAPDATEMKNACQSEFKEKFLPELNDRLHLMRIAAYNLNVNSGDIKRGDFKAPIKVEKTMLAGVANSSLKNQTELLAPLSEEEVAYMYEKPVDGKPFIYADLIKRDPSAVYYLAVNASPMLANFSGQKLNSADFAKLMKAEKPAYEEKTSFTRFDFQKQLAMVVKTIEKMPKSEQKMACQIAETYRVALNGQIARLKIVTVVGAVGAGVAAIFTGNLEALPPLARGGAVLLNIGKFQTIPLLTVATLDSLTSFNLNEGCKRKFNEDQLRSAVPTLCDTRDIAQTMSSAQSAVLWSAGGFVVFKAGAGIYRLAKPALKVPKN